MRNYAVEASELLTRWKRGEDVQDLLAHQLRHVSAALNTLQTEVIQLRADKERLLLDYQNLLIERAADSACASKDGTKA